MSIIFPLFGTGTPEGITTDGYFLDGTNLKRIKAESFEIDTIFSNVNGFFVDRKENLYVSGGGNVKKYVKNFRTGNFNLAWQASGGFNGGNTQSKSVLNAYPFISDFQNVAIDSQFNFYFRDTTDSNKLKKYSAGGQLITSTSSNIGAFAINKDGIFSFLGSTVTKRDLSGNSVSSFTVTGEPKAIGSDQVFALQVGSQNFFHVRTSGDFEEHEINFNTIRGYSLTTQNEVWNVNRITDFWRSQIYQNPGRVTERADYLYKYIPMKNGNLLVQCNVSYTFQQGHQEGFTSRGFTPFFGYILISPTGQILHLTDHIRFTQDFPSFDSISNLIVPEDEYNINSFQPISYRGDFITQYLYTQGANSDRSRLNF